MITSNIRLKIGKKFSIALNYSIHSGISKGTRGKIVSWNDTYIFVKIAACSKSKNLR